MLIDARCCEGFFAMRDGDAPDSPLMQRRRASSRQCATLICVAARRSRSIEFAAPAPVTSRSLRACRCSEGALLLHAVFVRPFSACCHVESATRRGVVCCKRWRDSDVAISQDAARVSSRPSSRRCASWRRLPAPEGRQARARRAATPATGVMRQRDAPPCSATTPPDTPPLLRRTFHTLLPRYAASD